MLSLINFLTNLNNPLKNSHSILLPNNSLNAINKSIIPQKNINLNGEYLPHLTPFSSIPTSTSKKYQDNNTRL
jgi:hypothetical protein